MPIPSSNRPWQNWDVGDTAERIDRAWVEAASAMGSRIMTEANSRFGPKPRPEILPAAARAYRTEFGHSIDEDLDTHQAEIEGWLKTWRAGYERGEPWATGMAGP